ncbi:hypothetical protein PORY_002500 [Pneumocystis oryctolagi]|uniref:Uncharacterized protein n=1 Tax=Pneumocystis oryctolagi TaxID=42067 RepID=A0ACB7C9E8_9ASCO|nr:hypothetical protein PORY_002500 [Pneumocystis oryctolagi]
MPFFLFKTQGNISKLRCFYCNFSFSEKRQKNLKEWLCPKCQAKNYLDNKGNIIDVPLHVVNMDKHSNIRYSIPSSKSIESSPFCQACIKNHSFIVNSLASYLPSEDHPDYHVYLSALPSYRAFLEEQYPMVCDFCSSRVQKHLAEKNYIAKSSALAGWLLDSKKTFNSKHTFSQPFLKTRLFIWSLRGIGWWVVTCSIIIYYILGIFVPDVFLKKSSQTLLWSIKNISQCLTVTFHKKKAFNNCLFFYKLFIRKLILWGIFVILWDYTWISQISKPDHRVFGKKYYYICQIFIHIIRASAEFIVSERILDTSIYSKINLILFFISIIHLILTFRCIYLIPPVSINLYDINSKDALTETKQKTNMKPKPVEKISSTTDKKLSPLLSIDCKLKEHQYSTDFCEDSMQLDPPEPLHSGIDSKNIHIHNNLSHHFPQRIQSLPSPHNTSICSNIKQSNKNYDFHKKNNFSKLGSNLFKMDQKENDDEIAPQKFFAPEQPTGLETIFSPALRLDDEPLIVRALRIVKRRKLNWIEIVSLLWAFKIIIVNILISGKIPYYSSFVGSFFIAFSIGSNSWFLKKTYIKFVFTGTIISFCYYLFIYINHYKNFETFLETSKTFFLCNNLITGFYFCYSLRILWTVQFFRNHMPSKKKTQKHHNKIWGNYVHNK